MPNELTRLLSRRAAVRRRDLVHPWLLDHAVRARMVVELLPGVYVETDHRREEHVRRVAALCYLDGRGALSHTTALAVWRIGWDEPAHAPVHATVAPADQLRGGKGLVLHRYRSFGERYRRGGLIVVPPDEAIVRSWPLLPTAARTGLVISAITAGHLTIDQLLDRLAGGYLLDVYAERERVAFELDGDSFHAGRFQRERDLRRDASLAALGIQVVRFTYARLMSEPAVVRREVLAILAAAAAARRGQG